VADELEWLINRYQPQMAWMADDVFTIHHGWLFQYAAELKQRGLKLPFECISRPDRLNPRVVETLAEMGCFRVWIGSESGSQRILDVDGNDAFDALTDGLLAIRYLFGITGPALTNGAIGSGATRTTPAAVLAQLDVIRPLLDVDGNGTPDALTDGLLIIRYLFGLRGASLIAGAVAPDATLTTAPQIEAYIDSLMH
jgi:hypothetical protein